MHAVCRIRHRLCTGTGASGWEEDVEWAGCVEGDAGVGIGRVVWGCRGVDGGYLLLLLLLLFYDDIIIIIIMMMMMMIIMMMIIIII
jgi:hypothetical protein